MDKAPVGTLLTLLQLMSVDTVLLIVAFLAGLARLGLPSVASSHAAERICVHARSSRMGSVSCNVRFPTFTPWAAAGAVAALGLALVPYYTGKIIDFATLETDERAFKRTTLKLVSSYVYELLSRPQTCITCPQPVDSICSS